MRQRASFPLAVLVTLLIPAAATAAEWPLPIPYDTVVGQGGNLKGVLVKIGTMTFQAKDFGLQRTSDDKVAIAWIQGYDEKGDSIRIVRTLCEGGLALGAAQVAVAADQNGFLKVALAGNESTLNDPVYPCGMSHSQGCVSRSCGIGCGEAPGCACQDSHGGGCDTLGRDWCDGTCRTGYCNTSVNDCRCQEGRNGNSEPPALPDEGKPRPNPPRPQKVRPKDPADPTQGND